MLLQGEKFLVYMTEMTCGWANKCKINQVDNTGTKVLDPVISLTLNRPSKITWSKTYAQLCLTALTNCPNQNQNGKMRWLMLEPMFGVHRSHVQLLASSILLITSLMLPWWLLAGGSFQTKSLPQRLCHKCWGNCMCHSLQWDRCFTKVNKKVKWPSLDSCKSPKMSGL